MNDRLIAMSEGIILQLHLMVSQIIHTLQSVQKQKRDKYVSGCGQNLVITRKKNTLGNSVSFTFRVNIKKN